MSTYIVGIGFHNEFIFYNALISNGRMYYGNEDILGGDEAPQYFERDYQANVRLETLAFYQKIVDHD